MILSPISTFGGVPMIPTSTSASGQGASPAAGAGLVPNSAMAAMAALAAVQQQQQLHQQQHQQQQLAAAAAAAGLMSPGGQSTGYFEGMPIYLLANHSIGAATAGVNPFVMPKLPDIPLVLPTSFSSQPRVDTSKHFHIFVGDLSSEIDNKALKEAFNTFGEISEVKVIRDTQTSKSKGYGFVTFIKKEDAERAIAEMNGQWLGRRTVRTNWASRKSGPNAALSAANSCTNIAVGRGESRESAKDRDRINEGGSDQSNDDCGPPPPRKRQIKSLTFDEILNQASPVNSTVYVGGISAAISDDELKQNFAKYGIILETRIFRQQGYAFVKYDQKESAAKAIFYANQSEMSGCHLRCSWGKEGGGGGGRSSVASSLSNLAFNFGAPTPNGLGNLWSQYYQCYNTPTLGQQWQTYWQQQQSQLNLANSLLLNSGSTQ